MQHPQFIELPKYPDRHLWLLAWALACLISLMLMLVSGLLMLKVDWSIPIERRPEPEVSSLVTLYLDVSNSMVEPAAAAKPEEKPFARTSPDQPDSTEKTNERIGERSTRATSENLADPTAPALPSQSGVQAKPGEIETTESRYQDGELIPATPGAKSAAAPVSPASPLQPTTRSSPPREAAQNPPEKTLAETRKSPDSPALQSSRSNPTISEESSPPPRRETLLDGPNPVEVDVPKEVGESERPKETPRRLSDTSELDDSVPPSQLAVQTPASNLAAPSNHKAFQGNQRKTAMVGSISRTGRSALNVDDTQLGRYQAAISKAVELEWQRNCVRYRDFITPGYITVRFFVEPSGRVRSQSLVGENETGEVQKGFTLSAIRDADIPEMPEELAESYEGDTLELLFRFYF
ncbi:MAG: hypothetical protein ACO3SO_00465 [Luteolibacter sp.]